MNHNTLLAEYKDALATQRWEVVAPLIHEDGCFIFNEGTYFKKAAIEGAVRATFDLIENEYYAIKVSFGPMSTTTAPPAHIALSGLD
jgi:hypothetical protein